MQPEFEQAARSGDAGLTESLLKSGAPGFLGQCAYDLALRGGMETLCGEIAAREAGAA